MLWWVSISLFLPPHYITAFVFWVFSTVSLFVQGTLWNDQHTKKKQGLKTFDLCRRDGCHLSVSTRSNCSERLEWKGNSNTNTLCFVETRLLPRCSTNGYPAPFCLFERLRLCLLSSHSAALLRERWGNGLFLMYLDRMRGKCINVWLACMCVWACVLRTSTLSCLWGKFAV